jgi:hypothetical protein
MVVLIGQFWKNFWLLNMFFKDGVFIACAGNFGGVGDRSTA